MSEQTVIEINPPSEDLVKYGHIVYGLQALGLLPIIGFIAAVVAIIINYIKLPEVQGTWLASHFRWQIRTFWFSLLWNIVGMILLIVLIGKLILLANFIWVLYRIIKGWIYLNDKREMVFPKP
ncbi:MAG: transrane protein [Gammaproteobacteria bacterium]|nr:transrane protein [Gammaproteobacteria bacterium]